VRAARFVHQRVDLGDHIARPCGESLAEIGRHHAAAGTVKEAPAQLDLERRDPPGEHRLRDAQRRGGARQAAQLGDRAERLQRLQIDDSLRYAFSANLDYLT
jgi:hypothetical protein